MHTTIATFGKNGSIAYRQQAITHAVAPPTKATPIWPSLQQAHEICNNLQIPKTAKNLKPLEAPLIQSTITPMDPADQRQAAAKKVNAMLDKGTAALEYQFTLKDVVATTSKMPSRKDKGKGRLIERISTPPHDPDAWWRNDLDNYENYAATYGASAFSSHTVPPQSREGTISLGGPEDEQSSHSLYD
jgi:hypothetical protein